jgi:acetyl esterase/lipase
MHRKIAYVVSLLALVCTAALFRPGVTQNDEPERIRDVIYQKKLGVALTMDVLKPKKQNGVGVLWMVSGGWVSNHNSINPRLMKGFTDRGHTVFTVVHGTQPKFTIQEIVQDIDRAVRFVRSKAADYGVDPNRLAIAGASAGCHLSLMQGARGTDGDPAAQDPLNRVSSRVQAVAGFFPPTDFLNYGETGKNVFDVQNMTPFRAAFGARSTEPAEVARVSAEISPVTYLTKAMPPTLIIHGDKDRLVPFQQAEVLMAKLEGLGVKHKLVVREGKDHGWAELPADISVLGQWIDEHLPKP